ncbi:DUF58 domain-containing protein [Vibrio sp. WXL210]|uniref:DUF58 domain-containing protein n=1 Tax=Vibrio sp. WXL210 TaxID=3450709 RepID=UPI003EC6344E
MTNHFTQITRARLLKLSALGAQMPFAAMLNINSHRVGTYDDVQRGQGHDFLELREYLSGDDIRNIDWKTTLKTGHHYVRLFADQKHKTVRLIVDLRPSMLFASQGSLKAVQACEAAALLCGYLERLAVNIDLHIVLDNVRTFSQINSHLLAQALETSFVQSKDLDNNPLALTDLSAEQCTQSTSGEKIIFISDFFGCHEGFAQHVAMLAKQNSLLGLYIHDPLEDALPQARLVLGDEESQISIDSTNHELRQLHAMRVQAQRRFIFDAFENSGGQLEFLTTQLDCQQQLIKRA